MARRELGGNAHKILQGQVLKGFFINTDFNQGPKQNSCIHTFKAYCDQKIGDETFSRGSYIRLWGSGVLDGELAKPEIVPGIYVEVENHGLTQPKKGGDPYWLYKVFLDDAVPSMSGDELGVADGNDQDSAGPVNANANSANANSAHTNAASEVTQSASPVAASNDIEDDDLPF